MKPPVVEFQGFVLARRIIAEPSICSNSRVKHTSSAKKKSPKAWQVLAIRCCKAIEQANAINLPLGHGKHTTSYKPLNYGDIGEDLL